MSFSAIGADMSNGADNFYRSDKVAMQKIAFDNLYKMKVVGNLFVPNDLNRSQKHAAIVVGHPMGAVKEQSANLYAQKLAERGFVTLTFDLSYWGESGGQPRNAVLPDVYADDFSAAVDFLNTQPFVDRERIGVLGICAGGGFVIGAAKIDLRMKAIATVSMVDMGSAARGMVSVEQRQQIIAAAAAQRQVEFDDGKVEYTGGTVHELHDDTPPMQREFYDFYRTPRGEYTPAGATRETTTHPTLTSDVKFLNFYPFNDIEMVSPRPMLFIAGDQAISRGFSEQAYQLAGEPKELHWVKGAGHVDLYDCVDLIPFAKLASFFQSSLK
ncbi:alpha/beta hydrolase [Pseudomonas citronellolis]|uniref:alpha/beta hydrolase n=1 Tax=Pseudomonas citronellolis TaxID=53408 RepID=UPI000853BD72